MLFINGGSSRLFLVCWEFLSECMLNFVECFFLCLWDNHIIFLLVLVCWFTRIKFWMLSQPWILGLNCVLHLLYVAGFDWVNLFGIFHLCSWRILSASFLGDFLSDFFSQDNAGLIEFVAVVQLLSRVWPCAPLWTAAHQAVLFFTVFPSLLRFMSTESVMPSKHLVLCHPLLLLFSVFLSIRVFSNELALCIRWPKYWSFSFSISPFNEYSGLISFRIDWFDLAIQGTLRSLLQHHRSKASILWHLTFFVVQLSHPNMTTGKTPGEEITSEGRMQKHRF